MPALQPVDEHAVEVDAAPPAAWESVTRVARGSFTGQRAESFARLLGAQERAPRGEFPEAGAAIPGFTVVKSSPPTELHLEGSHRFARYALVFRIDPLPDGRARVRAETLAAFPGLHGRAYRALVLGSGMHRRVVLRMLAAVRRSAARAVQGKGIS